MTNEVDAQERIFLALQMLSSLIERVPGEVQLAIHEKAIERASVLHDQTAAAIAAGTEIDFECDETLHAFAYSLAAAALSAHTQFKLAATPEGERPLWVLSRRAGSYFAMCVTCRDLHQVGSLETGQRLVDQMNVDRQACTQCAKR